MAESPVDSGRATKADIAHMKREARENEQAYQQGLDDSGDSDSDSGGRTAALRVPGGRLNFTNDAQKVIVISMTITGIVSAIEVIHHPAGVQVVPMSHVIVGTFVSGALLLGMSYFLPEFASGLAIVVMLVTVLERGKPFWDVIANVTGNTPAVDPAAAAQSVPIPERSGPGYYFGPGSAVDPNTGKVRGTSAFGPDTYGGQTPQLA